MSEALAALPDDALLEALQKQTFRFFWEGAEPVSGLARDRNRQAGAFHRVAEQSLSPDRFTSGMRAAGRKRPATDARATRHGHRSEVRVGKEREVL